MIHIDKLKHMYKTNDPFMGTIIVTLALFITNVLGYVMQLGLGRTLTIAEFGVFNTLLSLTYIFGFPTSTISTSLTKMVSELKAKDRFDILTQLFWKLSLYTVVIIIFTILFISSFRGFLADYLNIENHALITLFAVSLSMSFLGIIPYSYLQGLLRFKAFSVFNILRSMARVTLAVGFAYYGYSVGGVFVGLAISSIIGYFIALTFLKKNFLSADSQKLNSYYKGIITFAIPVMFVNVGTTILNNVDLILVKHFFLEETAGIYAGVVTMGKILLFGAGSVGVVMFPQISELYTKGEDYVSKFKIFLLIQVIAVVAGVIVFVLFPELITTILFGPKFLPSVPYIPRFAIFMGMYVLSSFMILFFLAISKTKVFMIQLPVVVLQFVLINLFHSSLFDVININIFISALLLCLTAIYYYYNVGFNNSSGLQKREDN